MQLTNDDVNFEQLGPDLYTTNTGINKLSPPKAAYFVGVFCFILIQFYVPLQSVGGAKTGEPREKHQVHPHAKLDLSHM